MSPGTVQRLCTHALVFSVLPQNSASTEILCAGCSVQSWPGSSQRKLHLQLPSCCQSAAIISTSSQAPSASSSVGCCMCYNCSRRPEEAQSREPCLTASMHKAEHARCCMLYSYSGHEKSIHSATFMPTVPHAPSACQRAILRMPCSYSRQAEQLQSVQHPYGPCCMRKV